MKLWKKIVLGLAVFVGGVVAYAMYMNRPPQLAGPDYYSYYLNQDTKPVGRVGIFVSHLVMPEHYREEDFVTYAEKILSVHPVADTRSGADRQGHDPAGSGPLL